MLLWLFFFYIFYLLLADLHGQLNLFVGKLVQITYFYQTSEQIINSFIHTMYG